MQTYSVRDICSVYHAQIHKFKGGRWRYKLTVSLNLQSLPCRDTNIQGYGILVFEICKVYHTQIQGVKGGRWRCKLTVSVKFAKTTIQKDKNSRVDVGVTNLQINVFDICKVHDTRIQHSRVDVGVANSQVHVFDICKVYHTKIRNSRVEVGVTNLQCS